MDNKKKEEDQVDAVEAHIIKRFNLHKKIGKGAYGVVFKATDKKTKEVVALKKLYDAFRNDTDAQRTFREVMILQELNGHDNIIRLLNVIKAENNMDLYLVFDYMEADLYNAIRANILQDIHKQYILYQSLKAMKFIHSADIIHRDLKPSNIFINSDCQIKIGDFGLARTLTSGKNGHSAVVTDYVATRWYRAPEMLLGSQYYSKSVDMWSMGCILAELLSGKPLFPGKSTKNQIAMVLEITGLPKRDEFNAIREKYLIEIDEKVFPTKLTKKSLKSVVPGVSPDALDLMTKLLQFDPDKRLTVDEALQHKYLEAFHKEDEEMVCDRKISIPLDDNKKYKLDQYRQKLYDEILKRKIEIRKKILESIKKKEGQGKTVTNVSNNK